MVRRPDDQPDGHQQRHRRPDRRRDQLPHRRHRTRRSSNNFVRNTGDDGAGHVVGERPPNARQHASTTTPCRRRRSPTASPSTAAPTTRSRTTSSPTRSARAAASRSAPASAPSRSPATCWITDNTTVRAGTYELNWNIGLGAIWFYALERNIDADIQVVGDHFLDNTYNAIMLVVGLAGEGPVLDHATSTSRTSRSTAPAPRWSAPAPPGRRRSRTWTPATSARSASTTAARSTSPRPARSSRSTDLGGNDGGGTTGPWLAPWELPNTITCDDRPPVVPPPPPSPW